MLGAGRCLPYRVEEGKRIIVFVSNQVEPTLSLKGEFDATLVYDLLAHLKERFRSTCFPHEVGLFLSYPPLDVEGFIRNGGRDYAYSGLWKVYSNIEKAAYIQGLYERCRQAYIRSYRRGVPLAQLCITA